MLDIAGDLERHKTLGAPRHAHIVHADEVSLSPGEWRGSESLGQLLLELDAGDREGLAFCFDLCGFGGADGRDVLRHSSIVTLYHAQIPDPTSRQPPTRPAKGSWRLYAAAMEASQQPIVNQAAEILYAGLVSAALLTPREQAEAAHHATGPSVDELEQRIIQLRGTRTRASGGKSKAVGKRWLAVE